MEVSEAYPQGQGHHHLTHMKVEYGAQHLQIEILSLMLIHYQVVVGKGRLYWQCG